jgi:ubiquitin carboxyl-terminal hydrolase MINDY-3/4
VGYLTQLESMRYLEVGGYFKTPRYPIWVVGSTSHFTVMFGDADCLQESQSDILLEKCRRAFKAIDGGEENGFIPTQALGGFLKSLDLDIPEHGVQTLAATIEMHGAGIILWDALWKHTSRLMTGATLEAVLQSTDPQNHSLSGGIISTTNDIDPLPLLLTPFGEADDDLDRKPSASSIGIGPLESLLEADEDMNLNSSSGGGAAAAAAAASPMDVDAYPVLSDEELARKLQEEWNAELSGVGVSTHNSLAAVRGSPTPSTWSNTANDDMNISGFTLSPNPLIAAEGEGTSTTDPPTSGNATSTSATTTSTFSNLSPSHSFTEPNNINMLGASQNHHVASAAATSSSSISTIGGGNLQNLEPHAMEHERYGRTFQLYHYNGLRGGALKPFRVTRLSPEEAVGASISLLGSTPSTAAHNGNGDLEDVIRTKWPSCMINWLGGPPPSID